MRLIAPLIFCAALLPLAAHAEWQAVEKVATYPVSGQTGAELYASIGQNGPTVGIGRAIAYTTFKLTWTRDYQPRGGGCVLVTARPKLTITYLLPKPKGKLPEALRRDWDVFEKGVHAHELVHGEMIKDLVRAIEATSVGLTVANHPNCKKIRAELTARLAKLSQDQRAKSRDFDRVEMGDGGNIQRLVLELVN